MGSASPNGAKARKEPALNVHHLSAQPSSRLMVQSALSPLRGSTLFRSLTHGLRRGLHSGGASRLKTGGLPSKLLFLLSSSSWPPRSSHRAGGLPTFKTSSLISADGSTLVKERINLVFIGQWHGIHRTIPIEYPGPRGTNYTLFLDITAVTDGAGQKLKYESKTSGGYRDLKIYIPGRGGHHAHGGDRATSSATAFAISKITTSSTGM